MTPSTTGMSIWRLHVNSNRYLALIPHDLNYFHDHFDGRPLRSDWSPPPITISGKSKKLPDIVGWMVGAPIVSERAKNCLGPVLGGCVQFLPFHDLKGSSFYAMNVVRVERDLLDLERSKITYGVDGDRPIGLHRAVFRPAKRDEPPAIFKAAIASFSPFGEIFVTPRFGEVAVRERLSGFELADPGQDSLEFILAGKSQNVVPGVVG